ncbi:MarR family transcriptional regulator [Nocardioides carbamazepini]|uniref:MarR family winged helix-turn-helix transcriptional regulator n=1 Tax=Nocardioides carbamazepini TaxID=2854259 RepID=UPI00214A461B|nr:MarR family transcriptional regulator [Nocardioides carbamazepini]MCR1785457.1 MarR family transcriptional regulator [Nocardioides carbamazepini]
MTTGHGELAVLLIGRASRLERAIGAALAGTPLKTPHWLVLTALHARPDGQTMTDLAQAVGLPAPTLTRSVDRLVDHALVHRALDGLDRRRVLVQLTDRGRATYDDQCVRVQDAIAAELTELADWEREALRGLLTRTS